jgi:intracellular septation protein
MTKKAQIWMRTAVDYACPLAFLATLLITRDFQRATWVLVGASAAALLVGWLVERRLAPIPLLAGVAALVFGTLTLVLHNSAFVKMKMTFVDGFLAAALLGGLAIERNPLKAMIGDSLSLPDAAWRTLTIRYAVFFISCALANELVWRTQNDARWAMFRVGVLVATVLFSFAQTPFLMKHIQGADEDAVTLEPPDPGF